jgi:hypothetical protein
VGVPLVRSIERKIRAVEGFAVRIVTLDGVDVRSDKLLPAQYDDHPHRAAGGMTVEAWRRVRFRTRFPGYEVKVVNADGSEAHGRTLLKTVRATYG